MKRLNVLILSDSFKGSLSSRDVANTVRDALDQLNIGLFMDAMIVGDGGEGTSLALNKSGEASQLTYNVYGAYGEQRTATCLVNQNKAFLDVAEVVGLPQIPVDQRRPLKSSTKGLGEVLLHLSKEEEVDEIILSCGGSATVDGGLGMLQSLGVIFKSFSGEILSDQAETLNKISDIEVRQLNAIKPLTVLVDVGNPLLGDMGAAKCFGPQKGASPEGVMTLEQGLNNFAVKTQAVFGPKIDSQSFGMGAAGGVPFACKYFLSADVQSGFDYFAKHLDLNSRIVKADLVITGEGKVDQQSFMGKVVGKVADLCKIEKTPLVVFCGINDLKKEQVEKTSVHKIESIIGGNSIETMLSDKELTRNQLALTVRRVIPLILDELF